MSAEMNYFGIAWKQGSVRETTPSQTRELIGIPLDQDSVVLEGFEHSLLFRILAEWNRSIDNEGCCHFT